MPLSPPWRWMLHEFPGDGDDVWCVRIGQPEKPWPARWDQGSLTFHTNDLPSDLNVPAAIVLKWRLQ